MPKIHQNTFGGGALPRPPGELMRSPKHPSHNGGLLLREREGGERKGRGGVEGKGISPKVKVSRINTGGL